LCRLDVRRSPQAQNKKTQHKHFISQWLTLRYHTMSNRGPSAPFTKFIDGFKKTKQQLKEETRKTAEHFKNLDLGRGDSMSANERTPLKLRARKWAADVASPPPTTLAIEETVSDDAKKSPTVKFAAQTTTKDAVTAASGNKSDEDVASSPTVRLATTKQTSGDVDYKSLESGQGGYSAIYKEENDHPSSSAANTTPSLFDMASLRLIVIAIISISTVYNTWAYRLDIALNEIPLIVAAHWVLIAIFIGNSFKYGSAITDEEESNVTSSTKEEEMRRIPMGLLHYSKMKAARNLNYNDMGHDREEFTNLKPAGKTAKKPISKGMMNQLLKNPDYGRRKSMAGEIDMPQMKEDCLQIQDELSNVVEEEGEEEGVKNCEMGTAPLGNMRASKLEREFDYVVPMCKFRGMDFFVGDFPEKEIWKQPLLLKNGLRDAPTMIGNLMLPSGNLVTYLQMPDWFDDWDNIPEEREDDPPDVKAFKRFFTGDLEYQQLRLKVLPMVVKAPYLVKMIAPDPTLNAIHQPMSPVTIKKVNKVVDPATGKTTAAAVMEVGVDFHTSRAIGRLINIVMPHLGSITLDIAFVVAAPWGKEGTEPSACLGVWRIDKVDFMSFAQLPEHPVEEVEEEIKDIMKSFAAECDSMSRRDIII